MPSSDDQNKLVPASNPKAMIAEISSLISSAIPYVGGPLSNILSGFATSRKIGRVRETLEHLADDLRGFQSEVTEEYVRTEEFEELLEQTLRRVGEERDVRKRRIYAAYLADDLKSAGGPYEEKLRFLKTLEQLQPDHLVLIKALAANPEPNPGMMGSPNQTLTRRLPDMGESRIADLISQLNDLRLTNITSLKVMMTGHGAADLRHAITEYGGRFLKYLFEV